MSIDALKSTIQAGDGLARPNKFHIELPTVAGSDLTARELNLLCRSATLPSKQIATLERRIGMEFEKMGYGYVIDDVNVSFLLLNDYKVKTYFDQWRGLIINEEAQTVGYKNDYQKRVVIHQLKDNPDQPGNYISVYAVELIDAFPVTVNAVEFNNDADAFLELSVSFAYTNWRTIRSSQQNWTL